MILTKMLNDIFTRFEVHNCSSGLFDLKPSLTFHETVVIVQRYPVCGLKLTFDVIIDPDRFYNARRPLVNGPQRVARFTSMSAAVYVPY